MGTQRYAICPCINRRRGYRAILGYPGSDMDLRRVVCVCNSVRNRVGGSGLAPVGHMNLAKHAGNLIGIEMSKEIAADVVTEAESNGLLLNAVRPTMLRLMPPLNVSREEVDEALAILDAALEKIG